MRENGFLAASKEDRKTPGSFQSSDSSKSNTGPHQGNSNTVAKQDSSYKCL